MKFLRDAMANGRGILRRRAAVAWVVRLDAGALSRRQERRLQHWLADPSNEVALRHASRMWNAIDDAVLADRIEAMRIAAAARPPSRRPRTLKFAALAIAALGTVWVGPIIAISLQADGRTGTGGSHSMTLADGSRVLLDSRSAVDIVYDRTTRRVRLLEGRARFEVAPDRAHPFIVEAAGGTSRALGTIFTVDRDGRDVEVDAIEHDIEVRSGGGFVRLRPHQTVRYKGGVGQPYETPDDVDAWTRGVVIFENASLVTMTQQLQRYSDRWLIVLGNARARRFSGIVRTSDPLGGIRAAAESDNLAVRTLPGVILISAR